MSAGDPMQIKRAAGLIQREGTPESDWQACEVLRAVPSISLDELVPAGKRLVVISPHPDDEVLACGGLLALHAARGGRSMLIAVTDGEASHRGDLRWPPAVLASRRQQESRDGLEALDATPGVVARLGLPDGDVLPRTEALADALVTRLHANDVVVTTWQGDGHPDHEASAIAAAWACEAARCALWSAPVWAWHWSAPGDPRLPWHRMRRLDLPPDVVNRKRRAIAAHQSQCSPRAGGESPVLGADMLARADRPFECFLS